MGHKHTKPGDCPTLFECHAKRALQQGLENVLDGAYEHEPVAVHCPLGLLFVIAMVVIGVAGWRGAVKRQARKKRIEAARMEGDKGGFKDEV